MRITKKALVAALAAVVAGATVVAASPAMADPVGAPTYRTLVGVGSDTTQDVNNGLSQVVVDGSGVKLIGSYDATGSATITTRSGGPSFNRPDGSGAGVTALKAAKSGTAYSGVTLSDPDIQFARSSSGATWTTGGQYTYIPLALDGVSFAKAASGTSVPANLTVADLTAIYSAADGASVTIAGTSYVVGNQANTSAQIRPYLPQANSGTRKFWLSAIGLTEATKGSAVADNYTKSGSSVSVQEHDGSVIADVTNAIAPFSIASWVAQNNATTLSSAYSLTVTDRRHAAVLGSVGGTAATVAGKLNSSFPIVRPVFTVVKTSELATNTALSSVFSTTSGKAYTALRPGGTQLVITDFGFGDLTGGKTINGVAYTAGATNLTANP